MQDTDRIRGVALKPIGGHMNRTDDEARAFIDSIPALAWSASSDGFALSVNRRWLDYTGLTEEAAMGWDGR